MSSEISFLVILVAIGLSNASLFTLEAELFKSRGHVVTSSGASGGKLMRLKPGQKHKMFFCLQRETEVSLVSLHLTAKGKTEVSANLDSTRLGMVDLSGKEDDKDRTLKGINTSMFLARGRHSLGVCVAEGNGSGVDVDLAVFEVKDQDITTEVFQCKTFCIGHIPFASTSKETIFLDTLSPGRAVQESIPTRCAEKDNIKIMIYHDNIKRYNIRARHPSYHTLSNKRGPNFSNCELASSQLWRINNFKLSKEHGTIKWNSVVLEYTRTHRSAIELSVRFHVEGRKHGKNDHDVGSVLSLALWGTRHGVSVSAVSVGKGRQWKYEGNRYYNHTAVGSILKWNLPDYNWSEDGENIVRLVLIGDDVTRASVKFVSLEKRSLNGDRTFQIYNDRNFIIEGVDIDMWWLKDNISITVEGQKEKTYHAHYFRLYFPVLWTGGFFQAFVMYQDGNVRLLPTSPHGADWIPFGSSVLIGQVDPKHLRPTAEITRVHIHPDNLELTVYYKDGGVAVLSLDIRMEETITRVEVKKFGQDSSKFPFAALRSMWVKDGNADVDHVSANGRHIHHILDKWGTLYGYAFIFYRSCISEHNTQSPDIKIELVE